MVQYIEYCHTCSWKLHSWAEAGPPPYDRWVRRSAAPYSRSRPAPRRLPGPAAGWQTARPAAAWRCPGCGPRPHSSRTGPTRWAPGPCPWAPPSALRPLSHNRWRGVQNRFLPVGMHLPRVVVVTCWGREGVAEWWWQRHPPGRGRPALMYPSLAYIYRGLSRLVDIWVSTLSLSLTVPGLHQGICRLPSHCEAL
jgi:hypothetical protein